MYDGDIVDSISRIMESVGELSSTSGELQTVNQQCDHFAGGSEFTLPLRLRALSKGHQQDFNKLVGELHAVGHNILRGFNGASKGSTRKYISQVLRYDNDEHRQRVLRHLRENGAEYPGNIFFFTDEGDHVHIVHDCAYPGGQCRCRIFKNGDFRFQIRSHLRRIRPIGEFDEIDWYNVFIYFILSKWPSESQVWIRGTLQESPNHNQIIRWRRVQTESAEVLARENERAGHHDQQQLPIIQNGGIAFSEDLGQLRKKRSATEGAVLPVKKRLSKFERVSQTVSTLLSKTYCIPALHIRDIYAHDSVSDDLYDPTSQKHVDAACALFTQRCNHMTLSEFKEVYQSCEPVFYANNKNPFEYYHDIDYSTKIITELLHHQIGDEEDITRFLVNLKDWFDKKGWEDNPKCNSISVIGPPNSGKNYFFDMIAAIAFNVGHIGRVNNKTNQFALQECYGRRMIVGNEISMEDGAMEDFKKLCEGTAFNIRVKFQGDKIFTKAPVLLIANQRLQITNHPAFEGIRNKTLYWKAAPLLKDSDKKPYPLCIFNVFSLFGINV